MKKIECIIRPTRLDDVNTALNAYGFNGMTVTQVMGCGLQKGRQEIYRGTAFDVKLLPKIKLEIVVPDNRVEGVIKAIRESAYSGEPGDGKIFISAIEDAIRIRTGDRGENAI